jgi:hypothetical protein
MEEADFSEPLVNVYEETEFLNLRDCSILMKNEKL